MKFQNIKLTAKGCKGTLEVDAWVRDGKLTVNLCTPYNDGDGTGRKTIVVNGVELVAMIWLELRPDHSPGDENAWRYDHARVERRGSHGIWCEPASDSARQKLYAEAQRIASELFQGDPMLRHNLRVEEAVRVHTELLAGLDSARQKVTECEQLVTDAERKLSDLGVTVRHGVKL